MKKTSVSIFVACLTLGGAHAATVSIQSGFAYGITNNANEQPAVGSGYLAVGYFGSLADGDLATTAASDLASDFQVFAGNSAAFGANGFGSFFNLSSDTGARIDATNQFVGQNIYFVAGNGSDLASSTEAVIYKFAETFVEDPDQPTPPASDTYTPDLDSSKYLVGTTDGSFDLTATNSVDGARMAVLIPEPSTALLGLLGFLGVMRRRR